MIISHVTEKDLKEALERINQKYENNITFSNFLQIGKNRYNVTLRVKDSKKAGHRISYSAYIQGKTRRLPYACWHVHGDFFDTLLDINPNAVVYAVNRKIYKKGNEVIGNWVDWNIGSIIYPLYYSEACDCGKVSLPKNLNEKEQWFSKKYPLLF
jgi:hypothetical protein